MTIVQTRKSYTPIEIYTNGERIQVWGISEDSINTLKSLARHMDANITLSVYCKHILRTYAMNNLKGEIEILTLREKLDRLRIKMDPGTSLSEYCRMILLSHLQESRAAK
jgi:hypothetical protein